MRKLVPQVTILHVTRLPEMKLKTRLKMYDVVIFVLLTSLARTEALNNAQLKYEIFEEQASRTLIGNVAKDLNLHESVTDIKNLKFSLLTKGNTDSSLFIADELSGDLMTSQLIDRESICSFMVTCDLKFEVVVQSNLGSFFRKIAVTVSVLDINDNAPKFSPDQFLLQISEGSVVGTTFPILKAIDQDTDVNNSVHSYEIVTNSDMFSLVVVKDNNGGFSEVALKLIRKLDREIVPEYQLTVIAKDNANPPKTGSLSLTVMVGDVNDNSPEFHQKFYPFNVSESLPVDALILQLNASDKDTGSNGDISYYFSPRQPESILKLFSLNRLTGELKTAMPLNTSVGDVFEIHAEARDHGIPVLTSQVTINIRVLDTDNNPPIINVNVFSSSGSAEVSESSTIGRAVAHIGVNDPDSGLNGIVNCSIVHEFIRISKLDVNEYKAILSKKLDREHIPEHTATVICYDAGTPPLTSSVEFKIKVLDENDNRPVFTRETYYASIVENNFIGQYINTVKAVDYDAGSNAKITYALAGEFKDSFKIAANGTVYVVKQLDREVTPVIRLKVSASDDGTPKLTSTAVVEIALEDQNDKRPEFNKTVFYFNTLENLKPGHTVGTVQAFDKDVGRNAEIEFKLISTDPDTPFSCTSDGVIQTTAMLDRETKDRYRFGVEAKDKGEYPLSSIVEVVVIVKDLNDQSPVILIPNKENNTVSIPNNLKPNTGFYAIMAYDMDQGVNSHLVYYLQDETVASHFTVHPKTGEVLIKNAFGHHTGGIFHLNLIVGDKGDPKRTTIADLYVQVYHDDEFLEEQSAMMSMQNIIIVAVIVCVTVILGLVVIVIIFYLRRRDKQRRMYNAKEEECRVIANMKQYETDSSESSETSGALCSQSTSSESVNSGSSVKKKEVSFSLDDDRNLSGDSEDLKSNKVDKTLFNQMHDEQIIYGKLTNTGTIEAPFKGLSPFLYHQKPIINERDNTSVNSGEFSISDSGRGGSDVEVSSHTVSHDSREMFFTQPSRQSFVRHSTRRKAPARPPPYYDNRNYAPSPDVERQLNQSLSVHSDQFQTKYSNNNSPMIPNRDGRYPQRSIPGRYNGKQDLASGNTKPKDDNIYMEMTAPISQSFNSSSACDDSKCDVTWGGDNDTSTTSGSYTVDADELCQEIDKLFFKQNDSNGDIIV